MSRGPEAALQEKVMALAKLFGWRRAHFRTAFQPGAQKWVTAMSGEKGYPDLTLVRGGRLIFAELKSEKGRLSPDQKAWLDDLEVVAAASGGAIEVHLWRPRDIDDIAKILNPNSKE